MAAAPRQRMHRTRPYRPTLFLGQRGGSQVVADLEESSETADVASHESFWLATAAAAPVIALAAVVALPDTSGIYRDVQRTFDEWFDTPAMFNTAMLAAGVSKPVVDETMPAIDLT